MEDYMKKEKLTLQLNLTVTYHPHGVSEEVLRERLDKMVGYAMGEGLLTGDTPAFIGTYTHTVTTIPQPEKKKKVKGRFHEGSTQVCAHRVTFFYRLPPRVRISKDVLFQMTEAAEERAQECISEGIVQGELNYETDRFQATGWWKIDD
jgi:hypothetical protein